MPQASVFAKALGDQRWQIAGFGLALLIMSATSVALWPSVRDTLQNFDLPDAVKAFLGSDLNIATPAGYLSARYFGWVDILLIVYAVLQGTAAIAGEESSGTMDLLLAQPMTRRAVVVQKAASTIIGATLIVALGWLGFAISMPFVSIDLSLADVAIASANMLPIALMFFALSLWAGAVAPSRGTAAAAMIGLVTAAYFLNVVATGVDSLNWLKYATPFYYYGNGLSLVDGINWPHVALLLGIAAAFVALALRTFDRRDVTIGGAADLDLAGLLRRIVARPAA